MTRKRPSIHEMDEKLVHLKRYLRTGSYSIVKRSEEEECDVEEEVSDGHEDVTFEDGRARDLEDEHKIEGAEKAAIFNLHTPENSVFRTETPRVCPMIKAAKPRDAQFNPWNLIEDSYRPQFPSRPLYHPIPPLQIPSTQRYDPVDPIYRRFPVFPKLPVRYSPAPYKLVRPQVEAVRPSPLRFTQQNPAIRYLPPVRPFIPQPPVYNSYLSGRLQHVPIVRETMDDFKNRLIRAIRLDYDPLEIGRTVLSSCHVMQITNDLVNEAVDVAAGSQIQVSVLRASSGNKYVNDFQALNTGIKVQMMLIEAKHRVMERETPILNIYDLSNVVGRREFLEKDYFIPAHAPYPFKAGQKLSLDECIFGGYSTPQKHLLAIYNHLLKQMTSPAAAIRLFSVRTDALEDDLDDIDWLQEPGPSKHYATMPMCIVQLLTDIAMAFFGFQRPLYNDQLTREERSALREYVALGDTEAERRKEFAAELNIRDYFRNEVVPERIKSCIHDLRKFSVVKGRWVRRTRVSVTGATRKIALLKKPAEPELSHESSE